MENSERERERERETYDVANDGYAGGGGHGRAREVGTGPRQQSGAREITEAVHVHQRAHHERAHGTVIVWVKAGMVYSIIMSLISICIGDATLAVRCSYGSRGVQNFSCSLLHN